jgi:uncharacterized protein (TIGR02145 family)
MNYFIYLWGLWIHLLGKTEQLTGAKHLPPRQSRENAPILNPDKMAKPTGKTRGINLEEATAHIRKVRKAFFLGIGIDQYQYFPKLSNAVKDVQDIADTLQQQYQFEPENIMLLLDEQASRVGIINTLDKLVGRLTEEHDLLIYYSGHGHLNQQTQKGFWIPRDAHQGTTADFIPNATIKSYMEDIPAFHTFLISDSCFSGSLFVQGKMRSTGEAIEELDSRRSRWALCSGRHDEEVYDGDPGSNSPFASSILRQLRQSKSSMLNVGRLIDEVVMQTRAHYRQLPEGNPMFDVGHQGGQFVFRLKYDDARDWAEAKTANTDKAYENYLALYPAGEYAREAAQKLLELREEEAWKAAQAAHTLLSYDQYLEQFPKGRHSAEAIAAIRVFNEAEDWRRAEQMHELWKYREYLQKYPDGQHAAQARTYIEQLHAHPVGAAQPSPPPAPPSGSLKTNRDQNKAWYFLGGTITLLAIVLLVVFWPRDKSALDESTRAVRQLSKLEEYDEVLKDAKYGSFWAVKKGDYWGFYNRETNFEITPQYTEVRPFVREMALVQLDNQYGWIDKEGQEVIPLIYEQVDTFNSEGLARVRLGGEEFDIDRAGQRVEEASADGERAAFEAALEKNTLAAYDAFLQEFPAGQFAAEAGQKIKILDEEAWKKALEADRYALYAQYLVDFPQGVHRTDAEGELKRFVLDGRDSTGYRTVQFEDTVWMAENANYQGQQLGQCYNQNPEKCQQYGRLYTWEEAKKACPPGWSLPSDSQWWSLAAKYGMAHSFSRNKSPGAGKRAYQSLMDAKKPGFAASLGGKKAAAFQDVNTIGYYWSGLRDTRTGDIIVYAFDSQQQIMNRTTARPTERLSCRCVRVASRGR